jgi:hypothetical protein
VLFDGDAGRGVPMARNGEFWTTESQAAGDRPDHWQRMLSATDLPWRVSIPDVPGEPAFGAWVRRWWIDDLALVDRECSPCSGTRQRRQLADTDGEFVVVLDPADAHLHQVGVGIAITCRTKRERIGTCLHRRRGG